MAGVTLITGGARSGKSTHAIALASADPDTTRRFFLATAEGLDDEMRTRIANHQRSRSTRFQTVEEPLALCLALESFERRADIVVVDCLTLWVSNLMGRGLVDDSILADGDALAAFLRHASFSAVVVTDEVGWGIVPDNAVARRFRDLLGWVNQKVADVADTVILMTAGCPLRVK
jgi:adenosylcobinamide kinase / adenosylcobinamide-phosphate guanylyltransferase